jgi:hydrogenase nickel incorporation protein HypA/HybF
VHEKALMDDLIRKLEAEASSEGAARVTRIRVRLGALSHFTEAHFREHFEHASRGTVADGAEVEAELGTDPTEPHAQGVVLESIDVETASYGFSGKRGPAPPRWREGDNARSWSEPGISARTSSRKEMRWQPSRRLWVMRHPGWKAAPWS